MAALSYSLRLGASCTSQQQARESCRSPAWSGLQRRIRNRQEERFVMVASLITDLISTTGRKKWLVIALLKTCRRKRKMVAPDSSSSIFFCCFCFPPPPNHSVCKPCMHYPDYPTPPRVQSLSCIKYEAVLIFLSFVLLQASCLCGSASCLLSSCCPSTYNSTISRLAFSFLLLLGTLVSIIMILPGMEENLKKVEWDLMAMKTVY